MKALVGSWDHRPYQLLAENTALRTKVAQLQEEVEHLREENVTLRHRLATGAARDVELVVDVDDIEVALSSS